MEHTIDYYQILDVQDAADAREIKRAYRVLARTYHPDHNPGDPEAVERFKRIQTAYEILSDEARRRSYDRARRDPFSALSTAAAMHSFGPGSAARTGRGDADDPLFAFFFGDAKGSPRDRDLQAQVQLTFDQALRGGRTEVRVAGGETVRVTIPKGVRSGVKVRVKHCGRPGADGTRGDLYVTFRIDSSARFRREGDNLHITETISALEAILGTTRSITNAYGQTVKVPIAAGTQPGERLRLRGQGVALKDRAGDLLVEIQVTVPRELTDEQRAELAAAAERVGLL